MIKFPKIKTDNNKKFKIQNSKVQNSEHLKTHEIDSSYFA